jgi:L-seryl-tRNA(Ser) seleniumtransferase
MKIDPHLPQLPSIGELLEHPRVKAVVSRLNRSTIAQRASGFLEELRTSLVERAGRVEVPSVAHLADRLARRLLGEPTSGGAVINATGIVVGGRDLSPPLADSAVHAMIQVASEYHDTGATFTLAAEQVLGELTGAEAALVLNRVESATFLAMAATAGSGELLVCEAANGKAASVDWPRLAARAGCILHRCEGRSDAVAQALARLPRLAAIVRAPGVEGSLPLDELKRQIAATDAAIIDLAPLAGFVDPQQFGYEHVRTLEERLAGGADLVVADGAGLVGGPDCGIIVGLQRRVDAAAQHPLAAILRVGALKAAGLHATLMAYRGESREGVAFSVPVWQLLSAPIANLQQRASRLATLIAASGGVASAEDHELESAWHAAASRESHAKTWVIRIRPKNETVQALAGKLSHASPAIVARVVDDAIELDLRSVFPRWDQRLVAAFDGEPPAASPDRQA